MTRVAVVTGAGSGIGAATSRVLAGRGHRLVLVDVREEAALSIAAELSGAGLEGEAVVLDVSNQEAAEVAMAGIIDRYQRIDVLVNNAATFVARGLDSSTADWNLSLGVNIQGYANMVQACLSGLLAADAASIVNVASISAHVAQPNRWTYNATKGAIVSMTRCMALDLSEHEIRVNSVSPGWIWTPEVSRAADGDRSKWEPIWGRFHMLRRLGEPEEVARVIAFLCSTDASFITGAEIPVDGGYTALGPEGLGDQSTFAGFE